MKLSTLPVLALAGLVAACGGSDDSTSYEALRNTFIDIDQRAVAEGAVTSSSMPTAGRANYSGTMAYLFEGETTSSNLSAMNLTASFFNKTMTGSLTNFVSADGTTTPGRIDLTNGQIVGNTYTADLTGSLTPEGSTITVAGNMDGSFYREDQSLIDSNLFLIWLETGEVATGFGVAEKR